MRRSNEYDFGNGNIFLKIFYAFPVALDLDFSFLTGENHPEFTLEYRCPTQKFELLISTTYVNSLNND